METLKNLSVTALTGSGISNPSLSACKVLGASWGLGVGLKGLGVAAWRRVGGGFLGGGRPGQTPGPVSASARGSASVGLAHLLSDLTRLYK